MRREDFMRQLEALLADVSQEEKEEALSYYQGYFEDAGAENEERILRELESPAKVAATIKADLNGGQGGAGEYTEHGFTDSRFEQRQEIDISRSQPEPAMWGGNHVPKETGQPSKDASFPGSGTYQNGSSAYQSGGTYQNGSGAYQSGSGTYQDTVYRDPGSRSTYRGDHALKIIAVIAVAVITSPIWLGFVTGAAGTVLGIAISAVCVAGAFYIAGIAMFGVGIAQAAVGNLAVGFGVTGAGLLVLALAVLATLLSVWIWGKLIPWMVRAAVGLCRGFFSRKEQEV
ncbi:DUF1700 domain-containing protein [Lachnospiraceae bacterium 29-84]